MSDEDDLINFIDIALNKPTSEPDDLGIALPGPRELGEVVRGLEILPIEDEISILCNLCETTFHTESAFERHMTKGQHTAQPSEWTKDGYRTVPDIPARGWRIERRDGQSVDGILPTRLLALFTISQLRRRDIGLPYNFDPSASAWQMEYKTYKAPPETK